MSRSIATAQARSFSTCGHRFTREPVVVEECELSPKQWDYLGHLAGLGVLVVADSAPPKTADADQAGGASSSTRPRKRRKSKAK